MSGDFIAKKRQHTPPFLKHLLKKTLHLYDFSLQQAIFSADAVEIYTSLPCAAVYSELFSFCAIFDLAVNLLAQHIVNSDIGHTVHVLCSSNFHLAAEGVGINSMSERGKLVYRFQMTYIKQITQFLLHQIAIIISKNKLQRNPII